MNSDNRDYQIMLDAQRNKTHGVVVAAPTFKADGVRVHGRSILVRWFADEDGTRTMRNKPSKNTVGHLATADGRVITNSVDAGADLDVVEARGAAVLAAGESYTVEVGADDIWARMAFFNDWFELTGRFPIR